MDRGATNAVLVGGSQGSLIITVLGDYCVTGANRADRGPGVGVGPPQPQVAGSSEVVVEPNSSSSFAVASG